MGFGVAVLVFLLQVLLHNRVRIDKLGTAATSVTLTTDKGTSFFDKYLDEIVYFFEMTKRNIVIIEDLDRFEDPAIYASLRALNTVLNTSRQVRKRPVHFIYAVRDSIFEDIEAPRRRNKEQGDPAGSDTPTEGDPRESPAVWQADRAISDPPTQRTKFFDLVIPIVPFITHRSAGDLLTKTMEQVDLRVPADVIRAVSRHVTDMRLLLNIANEYRVFRARILAPDKLAGLTPGGLFAIVAYKGTHLEDFELIRVGTSSLDKLYRVSREIIDDALSDVAKELTDFESSTEPVAETLARAEQLGALTQGLAERWLPRLGKSNQYVQFWTDGAQRTTAEIATPEFWAKVIDSKVVIEVRTPSEPGFSIDAAGLRTELGDVVPEHWLATTDSARQSHLAELREQQGWLRSADFQDLTKPIRPLKRGRTKVDFNKIISEKLRDPLLIDLVRYGHINRNFPLYASEFHGKLTTANAMTFLIQHIQAGDSSYGYKLSENEIKSVIAKGGPEVFGSVGLYNVDVYDYLLATGDERLARNIALLAWSRPVEIEFIEAYTVEGKESDALFKQLAPHWTGIFEYIGGTFADSVERLRSLSLSAFEGADPELEYRTPGIVRDKITSHYLDIRELTSDALDPHRAVAMLQRTGARLPSLKGLSPQAVEAVVQSRQYVVTSESLQLALREEVIGLDVIARTSRPVFDHVVAHLDEYLESLRQRQPETRQPD